MLRPLAWISNKSSIFNRTAPGNFRSGLIWVSVKSGAREHSRRMMSQTSCTLQAETCEQRSAECTDAPSQAHWLAMATEWRALAGDKNDQATLARLMGAARSAS